MPKKARPVDPQSQRFGANLRALREAHGLTQETVAERIGVTPSAYQHYETGRSEPRFTNAPRLAEAIGVHPCELLAPWIEQAQSEESPSLEVPAAIAKAFEPTTADEIYAAFIQGETRLRKVAEEELGLDAEAAEMLAHLAAWLRRRQQGA